MKNLYRAVAIELIVRREMRNLNALTQPTTSTTHRRRSARHALATPLRTNTWTSLLKNGC